MSSFFSSASFKSVIYYFVHMSTVVTDCRCAAWCNFWRLRTAHRQFVCSGVVIVTNRSQGNPSAFWHQGSVGSPMFALSARHSSAHHHAVYT